MAMLFDSEQELLADTARDFFAQHAGPSVLRKLRDNRDEKCYVPEDWHAMAELGWSAIIFPEAHGGLAFGYKGLGAVFEQAGRQLAASPLFATVCLGGAALMLGGNEAQQAEWLPRIIAGDTLFALALDEKSRHDPSAIALTATPAAAGWVLNGQKAFVADGGIADQFVVVARSAEGISLFLVAGDASGLTRQRRGMADSRNMAALHFDKVQVPATALIGAAGQGGAIVDAVLDRARVCLAAEMLGAAGWLFDATVRYLKEREQFDVLIGTFQALQHRAAQMYVSLEMSRSAVLAALAAIDEGSPQLPALASLAKARMADTLELISNEAVQMHGGIGMTDEFDVGLYLKRARVQQQFLGDASFHRERYATQLGF